METLFMQAQSFCIVVLMLVGASQFKKRKLHIRLMSIAMVWDVLLILQIELSRSAIIKASKALNNTLILNIHVAIAIATVVLYGFMIHSGRKLLAGEIQIRNRHKNLGRLTLLMRIFTFITSFWAVVPKD